MSASVFARIKQRLSPNQATKLSLIALGWCDDFFRDEWMWSNVREYILPTLYMRTPLRDKMVNDERSASRFLLGLIADVAERWVITGNYHTYRATLSMNGQSLRNIAELALSELHENEWLSYEDYQARLEIIDEWIKSAG